MFAFSFDFFCKRPSILIFGIKKNAKVYVFVLKINWYPIDFLHRRLTFLRNVESTFVLDFVVVANVVRRVPLHDVVVSDRDSFENHSLATFHSQMPLLLLIKTKKSNVYSTNKRKANELIEYSRAWSLTSSCRRVMIVLIRWDRKSTRLNSSH